MRNQQLSLKEIKRKGFQNQRKNLEFRGKGITVDIKNWNILSEGLSTKHICQLLKGKRKKKIVYNFVRSGNQIGRSLWGGKGVIFFFFFPSANALVNDIRLLVLVSEFFYFVYNIILLF